MSITQWESSCGNVICSFFLLLFLLLLLLCYYQGRTIRVGEGTEGAVAPENLIFVYKT